MVIDESREGTRQLLGIVFLAALWAWVAAIFVTQVVQAPLTPIVVGVVAWVCYNVGVKALVYNARPPAANRLGAKSTRTRLVISLVIGLVGFILADALAGPIWSALYSVWVWPAWIVLNLGGIGLLVGGAFAFTRVK